MIVFLRNIPISTGKYEIAAFIDAALDDCFEGPSPIKLSVQDIEFLTLQDMDVNKVEKHALIRLFPQELAKRVIKHIDGAFFKDTTITAREYVNRSLANDPRRSKAASNTDFTDRRIADRRRKPLMNAWQSDPILVQAGQ